MNITFDKQVVCGPEYVALREIQSGKTGKLDSGFYLSEDAFDNNKLGFYVVENVGTTAQEEYGLKEGDYVMADRLASFYHTSPVCVMKYNNVILKTNKDRTEYHPVKGRIFVEEDKKEVHDEGGFYIQNDPSNLRLGTVTDMNLTNEDELNYPFTIGSHVMLVRGGDYVEIGGRKIFVFSPDQITCVVMD